MSHPTRNLRRAIRDDRMRKVYDTAIECDWTARLDGAGHIRMTSPDGNTVMNVSTTAAGGRAALNTEAVLKRWLRLQNTITAVSGLPARYPTPQPQEAPDMGQDLHQMKDAEADAAEAHDAALDSEAAVADTFEASDPAPVSQFYCADGCGKPVSKEGGYARGHHPNTKSGAVKGGRAGKGGTKNGGPSLFRTNEEPRFTIAEVVTVANYGGTGGMIEVSKLKEGLDLVARMRGEE